MGYSKSSPGRKFIGEEAFFKKQQQKKTSNKQPNLPPKKEMTGIQRTMQKGLNDHITIVV